MNIVTGYNDNPRQPQSGQICRFYQRGICRFGNRCRNIHSDIATPVFETKTSPTKPEEKPSNISPKNEYVAMTGLVITNPSIDVATGVGPSTSTPPESNESLPECGICFDKITEKQNRRDQTYGILPNCNHCFCFACIRKWRQSKEFDFDVSKACPECRKPSDFVYPSKIWFELKEDKESFISKEKLRMQQINCRYFNCGLGSCPFGNTCLYLHALPNGKKIDVGPPKPRRRRTSNLDNEMMMHQILHWLDVDAINMDEDFVDYDDDDYEDVDDDDFELDLDDPTIAMQYYDHDDIRRYIAIDRLMNPGGSDEESDLDFPLFL